MIDAQPDDASYDEILRTFPLIGHRHRSEAERESWVLMFGHYHIAYLVRDPLRIDILGVFYTALDINRYLRQPIASTALECSTLRGVAPSRLFVGPAKPTTNGGFGWKWGAETAIMASVVVVLDEKGQL